MIVSILTDNCAGGHTHAEHGLSYFIEYGGKKILFDTGQSDMFIQNAEKMNIDITSADLIVLSHGHFDHGNGLEYLAGGTLICHPGCFDKHYRKKGHTYIGLKNTKEGITKKFDLVTSAEPYKISEKIIFAGEIPRITAFESKTTPFVLEDGTPDFITDDSALIIIHTKGLFVITGCGHSGIVNTLEHAKKITGIHKIYGIMGGFHLKEQNPQLKESILYLKEKGVKHVYPSHCTALPALSEFYRTFKTKQVCTGDEFAF